MGDQLAASTFNQLGQHGNSPGHRAYVMQKKTAVCYGYSKEENGKL